MADALVEYIKKEVEKGVSNEDIIKALADVGHSKEAIEEAFNEVLSKGKKHVRISYAKRIYEILAILVVLTVITLYFLNPNNIFTVQNETQEKEQSVTTDISVESEPEQIESQPNIDISEEDTENFYEALNKNDSSLCKEDSSLNEICIALIEKRPELCETSIVGNYCYMEVARKLGDASLCEKAGELKSNCYIILASLTRDPSLCNKTKSPERCEKNIN